MGDFNINLLNYDSDKEVSEFLDLFCSNPFLPAITKPTRITRKTKTLIDNIFYNSVNQNITSGNLTVSISDHLPQFLFTQSKLPQEKEVKPTLFKRNFNNFDPDNFILDLLDVDWDKELNIDIGDINFSYDKFQNIINKLLDKYAPIKKVNKKMANLENKPWLSGGLLKSIKIKNNLHKKFIQAKDPDRKNSLFNSFKKYRNIISTLLAKSKENYYKEYFLNHKYNLQKTWKGIKSIIHSNNNENKNIMSHN